MKCPTAEKLQRASLRVGVVVACGGYVALLGATTLLGEHGQDVS